MKWLLAVAVALLLAAAGTATAVALTASTGTVSACATTPAQTIAVNSSPVSTVPAETACTTVTYTVPTVTETVTATTVPVTTTAPMTTTTSSSPTYDSEIAYTQTRPAFTPARIVLVSSGAQLLSAVAGLQAGDLVKASTPFTLSGGGTTDPLIIANRLSAPAEIDLTGVSVVYTGTGSYNAVWVRNAQNVRLFGGDISMTQGKVGGGSCIGWTGSQHTMWWGFYAHGCGSGGMGIFTAGPAYSFAGPTSYDDIEGEIANFSLNHGLFDNHAEKCSGIHGANLSDNNWYAFDHNRIALNVHDSACTGGGIEFGASKSPTTAPAGPIPDSNTIILRCANLSFVSVTQTGGNCIQFWGYGVTNLDLEYVEADNIQGHNVWSGGLYGKPSSKLATDTIRYARATSTDLNPRYAHDCTDNKEGNPVFKDAAPAPCYAPFTS